MKIARLINEESVLVADYETMLKDIEINYRNSLRTFGVTDDVIAIIIGKPEQSLTIMESGILRERASINKEREVALAYLSNFKEYVQSDAPIVGELDSISPFYRHEDCKIVQHWRIISNNPQKVRDKIKILKKELSDTDYKVIKFQERLLTITDNPMTPEELEAQRQLSAGRQDIRDQINNLQKLL